MSPQARKYWQSSGMVIVHLASFFFFFISFRLVSLGIAGTSVNGWHKSGVCGSWDLRWKYCAGATRARGTKWGRWGGILALRKDFMTMTWGREQGWKERACEIDSTAFSFNFYLLSWLLTTVAVVPSAHLDVCSVFTHMLSSFPFPPGSNTTVKIVYAPWWEKCRLVWFLDV